MTDHIEAARIALAAAIADHEGSNVHIAQVHALIAIAESLALMTRGPVASSVSAAAASPRGLLPGEAEILSMPQPRGNRCPICQHGTVHHRMHGCDAGECECTAPHGRILPGDPQPGA